MKKLTTKGNYTLGILDDDNYVVFDHTKPPSNERLLIFSFSRFVI